MAWLSDGEKGATTDNMFSRFDTISACDRQTDGQTTWTDRRNLAIRKEDRIVSPFVILQVSSCSHHDNENCAMTASCYTAEHHQHNSYPLTSRS